MRVMRTMCWILAVAALAAVVVGCAEQRPERSYVQANVIPKSIFTGTWYYKMTVIDHPYEAKFTFIGDEAGQLEKIRWVIDENFIYAYRAYETVLQTEAGKCAKAGTTEYDTTKAYCYQDTECNPGQVCLKASEKYYGSPVAAYKILSHFDIQRQYNPTTGEEINVLEENSRDRLWWQRDYMHIDWSANQVYDFFHWIMEYVDPMYANMKKEPITYFDQKNFVVTPDYIDIVNREVVSPTADSLNYESSYPVVLNSIPITFRHSFLKVVPNDYQPLNYPDPMFEHFGYFRLDREGFDNTYGLNEITRNYNVERWNIFKRWKDDNGNLIPVKQREIRKITYYLNKDFPANLRDTAYSMVRDWDVAYRRTLAAMLEAEGETEAAARQWVESKIDKAANNGWGAAVFQLKDNDECDPVWQAGVVDENGQPALRDAEKCMKNPGDLRYSMIYWIPKPMAGGPLGLAGMEADPETGELINCTANIYGAAMEIYKAQAMFFWDIVKAKTVDDKDITEMIAKGEDIRSALAGQFGGVQPMGPQGGPWKPGESAKAGIDRLLAQVRGMNIGDDEGALRMLTNRSVMMANYEKGRKIAEKMPEFEQMLLGPDVMIGKTLETSGQDWSSTKLTNDQLEQYSPLRYTGAKEAIGNFHNAQYLMSRFRCIYEANEFTDWSVWRLVQKYAVEQNKSRDEVANIIDNALFRQVTAHEVGHTMGLRHQFQATADAMNFFDQYWKFYNEVVNDPAHPELNGFDLYSAGHGLSDSASYDTYLANWNTFRTEMKKKGADFYQYTTIMDYSGQWYTDGFPGVENAPPWTTPKTDLWAEQYPTSIGKYDMAAIKFGYGQVAEKWGAGNTFFDRSHRKNYKYYYGGEDCASAACPHADIGQTCLTGVCRPVREGGGQVYDGGERCLTDKDCPGYKSNQRCETDPSFPAICSEFFQNTDHSKDDDWSEGNPIIYAMCSDERTDDQPFCTRWDEGATSQEIVANMIETYNRNYIFNNFRRYRRNFGFTYESRIFGRYFTTIGKQYQAMLYNYFYKPGMRANANIDKPGGLIDMYMASAMGLNFFNAVLGQPDLGGYQKNDTEHVYQRVDTDPNSALTTCTVHWGEGKYYWHRYEPGFYGQIYRLALVGTVIDKILALDAMSTRDWNFPPTSGLRFYINYYDFFRGEVLDIFTGALSGDPAKYGMIAGVDPATGHCTMTQRNVWYGGAGFFGQPLVSRDPNAEYAGAYAMEGAGSFYNQYYAYAFAMERFPVFFDASFGSLLMKIWQQGDVGGGTGNTDPTLVCKYESPNSPKYTWYGLKALDQVSVGSTTTTVDRSMTCSLINRANHFLDCYNNPDLCPGSDKTSYYYDLQSIESFLNIVRGVYASGL